MGTQGRPEDSRLAALSTGATNYPLEIRRHWLEDFFGKEPCSTGFFQTVRLLCRLQNGLQPPGLFPRDFNQEVVRFAANPEFWFPPSENASLEWRTTPRGDWRPPLLRVNFMGLIGPSGVLPLVYSSFLMERLRARDRSMLEFFDLFHHRLISLFYQAWEKYRFFIPYERGEEDRMSGYLRSFLGLGTPGLVNRQDVPDTSLIYYAGLLSLMPKSALGLQQFISDYFDVPILVEEFGGSWHALSEQDICQFADPPTEAEQLGFGVVVGDAVWDRASRARMRVGPLKIDRYLEFLPGGKGYRTIQALTRFYTNGEIIFEVQLILDRDSVPPCQLGADSGAPPQLGWLTWMNLSRPRLEDPGDTIYVLQ